MDLLKTILIYMSMIYVSSVQMAPEATVAPAAPSISPAATLTVTATPKAADAPSPTPVPTPAITPNNAYKTLKVGDRGENVKELQSRLAELRYYTGEIDGSFGNQTRRAVERFQYFHGLSSDGIAGKRTLTVLYESEDVIYAPVDDVTSTSTPKATPTSTPRQTENTSPNPTRTTVPEGVTIAPTFVPTPSPASSGEQTKGIPTGEGLPVARKAEASPTGSPETDRPMGDDPQDTAGDGGAEEVPIPMEGYRFVLADEEEPLLGPAVEGSEGKVLEPMKLGKETVLVPFFQILEQAGVIIVPAEEVGHAEYAFAIADDLYRLAYDVDEAGNAAGLSIIKNNLPQMMQKRIAVLLEGMLYLPMDEVQVITGITFTQDEAGKTYWVDLVRD